MSGSAPASFSAVANKENFNNRSMNFNARDWILDCNFGWVREFGSRLMVGEQFQFEANGIWVVWWAIWSNWCRRFSRLTWLSPQAFTNTSLTNPPSKSFPPQHWIINNSQKLVPPDTIAYDNRQSRQRHANNFFPLALALCIVVEINLHKFLPGEKYFSF